jgi:serine/threonine protein kinase
LRKQQKEALQQKTKQQKKNLLSIYDYKKFKFMKDISSRYTFGQTLGQGAFGLVRLCTHTASGKEFAIKIMTKK